MSFNIRKKLDPDLVRLAAYALPYRWKLLGAACWMVIVAGTTAITSKLLGMLTEQGFYEQDTSMIVIAPAALIAITLLYAVALVMSSYMLTKISQSILVKLRMQLFSRMLRWPPAQYQEYTSGEVGSKFINEANIALSGAAETAMVLVRDSLQVLALFSLLLWQNWQLTLVACIVGPLAAFLLGIIRRKTRKVVKENQAAIANTLSCVQETYRAQRVIKVSETYQFEKDKFKRINDKIKRTTLKQLKLQGLGTPITQIVTMMGVAVVVGFALAQAREGQLTVGEFITFLSAMLFLMQPLQNLAGLNATFTRISVAARSIFSMMDLPIQEDSGSVVLNAARGEIVFENAQVRYPGSEVSSLDGINLTIRPGEHVALIGLSGSGKTTTVNLLPRFAELTDGSVKIDGVDVREYTLESLRNQIAIVSQDVVLFDATIRENVAYGCPTATDADIEVAMNAAALTDFLKSLPKGLDSPVGEGGRLLSGGQKQRISIARAILKNAPIVILDEATSALDSESENTIKRALNQLMNGRTCLLVAHRLSMIDSVDKIVAMKEGRIVEEGAPAELLAKGGVYAEFCRLQQVKV